MTLDEWLQTPLEGTAAETFALGRLLRAAVRVVRAEKAVLDARGKGKFVRVARRKRDEAVATFDAALKAEGLTLEEEKDGVRQSWLNRLGEDDADTRAEAGMEPVADEEGGEGDV